MVKFKLKIKSNKGYIFTYEAIIVAFIFVSIFYIGYMTYSHNFLTSLENKKDTEKFHKALYLKDYYLKKYSFPGNYSTDYSVNFISRFEFNADTFDPSHNFSNDNNHFGCIVHSSIYDKWLKSTPINATIPPSIVINFSNGENFTIYSNVNNSKINNSINSTFKGDVVVFNENVYIPKITYHNNSEGNPKIYGCNGDIIYFLINGANIHEASVKLIINNSNIFDRWSNWRYISPILVKNRLNTALTDYTVKITFNSNRYILNNEMNENCSDVRFIDDSGNELSYWIEPNTINTPHTVAWVKINLGAEEVKRIYMLYGNPNADSHSDGVGTFIFFDDFSSGDLTKWVYNFNNPIFINKSYNNGINYTYLCLNYSNYTTNHDDVHIMSPNDYNNEYAVRFHAKFHKQYDEWAGFYKIDNNGKDYNRQIISNYHWGGEYLRFECSETDDNHIEYRILPIGYYDSWNTYELRRNRDDSVSLLINDEYYRSINNYIYTGNLPISFYAREFDNTNEGYTPTDNSKKNGHIDIDWVFVRKYNEPEPEVINKGSDVIFTVNGKIYRKPLLSISKNIDIIHDLINNEVNEIRILNSAYPLEFEFTIGNNADFSYVVFSPRNITIMVKP